MSFGPVSGLAVSEKQLGTGSGGLNAKVVTASTTVATAFLSDTTSREVLYSSTGFVIIDSTIREVIYSGVSFALFSGTVREVLHAKIPLPIPAELDEAIYAFWGNLPKKRSNAAWINSKRNWIAAAVPPPPYSSDAEQQINYRRNLHKKKLNLIWISSKADWVSATVPPPPYSSEAQQQINYRQNSRKKKLPTIHSLSPPPTARNTIVMVLA